MANYGKTSKELEEEYENEEEPIEKEYIRTFPKSHSSILPHLRLDVKLPNTNGCNIGSLKVKIPKSDIYNMEWRNFNTNLFGKKKK
jgi:hypothetical protein